jgi:hypothetical protein
MLAAGRSAPREIAPMIAEAVAAGHTSLRAVAEYLNALEITTSRGKAWTATAVRTAPQLLKSH